MGIRFDLSGVKDPEELWVPATPMQGEHLVGKADALVVFGEMLGINHITARNVSEVFYRLQELEKLNGQALVFNDKGPMMYTEDDVRRLVGMKISVVPKTNEQFDRDVKRWQKESAAEKQ